MKRIIFTFVFCSILLTSCAESGEDKNLPSSISSQISSQIQSTTQSVTTTTTVTEQTKPKNTTSATAITTINTTTTEETIDISKKFSKKIISSELSGWNLDVLYVDKSVIFLNLDCDTDHQSKNGEPSTAVGNVYTPYVANSNLIEFYRLDGEEWKLMTRPNSNDSEKLEFDVSLSPEGVDNIKNSRRPLFFRNGYAKKAGNYKIVVPVIYDSGFLNFGYLEAEFTIE